jgi:enterochelin esterase family protein
MARYTHVEIPVQSGVLAGNPLGDPTDRILHVLVPDDGGAGAPYPVVWVLPAYASTAAAVVADDPWDEGLRQRVERLSREGALPPALFAVPDLFTGYGGSQYLNSPAVGRYEDHLWQELKPALEARFPTGAHGLVGRSSGGYGAFVQALRHPELVRAVAAHAPDVCFPYAYLPDLLRLATLVAATGSVEAFLAAFAAAQKKRDGRWIAPLNALCMAACYSPAPGAPGGFELPIDLATGALRPEVWERWLAHDPLRLVDEPGAADRLRGLRLLFLDCGSRDEYGLQWGLRQLVHSLRRLGVPCEHEEFPDGHRSTSYRFDVSLPRVVRALRGVT